MQVEAQEAMREALRVSVWKPQLRSLEEITGYLKACLEEKGFDAGSEHAEFLAHAMQHVIAALSLNPPLSLDAGAEPVAYRAMTRKWGTSQDEEYVYGPWVEGALAPGRFEPLYTRPQPSIDKPAEPKKRGYLGSTVDGGIDDHDEEPAEPSAEESK